MGSARPWIIAVIVFALGGAIWWYGNTSGAVVNEPEPDSAVQPPADEPAADAPASDPSAPAPGN